MAAVSKEEYLKRYLSNTDSGVKKKRKKKVKTGIKTGRSLIIDDDVSLSDIVVKKKSETEENLLELADETPLIFNETGTTVLSADLETIRKKEDEKKAMWAPVKSFQEDFSGVQNTKDLSPVRSNFRRRHDSSSPERSTVTKKVSERQGNSISSNQIRARHDSDDISPPRRIRHDSSSDQSPPRQEMKSYNNPPDLSPRRRNAMKRSWSPKDQSPPRGTRHDSPDQSPPRYRKSSRNLPSKAYTDSDVLPLQARSRSPLDQSPPRRTRHDSSSDQSPPRSRQPRQNHRDSPDLSPPRKKIVSNLRNRHDSSSDQSPPRNTRPSANVIKRSRHASPDLSPPRKESRHHGKMSSKGGHNDDASNELHGTKQKNSVHKAGLHSAAELREENERTRQRENEVFARMNSSTTGKDAETIHRDKRGRKRDFKVEEVKKREEERKKEEENEKFMEWGKGVQQTKSVKEKIHDDLYEMSKPLARYKDDQDLDRMLRDRERAEDPMLAFMQKKKSKQDTIAGKKEKPKYRGPAPPPNRFNIPPGYRWDGVDRSNGFEKKRFSMLANKGATREEAYKWSTEDM